MVELSVDAIDARWRITLAPTWKQHEAKCDARGLWSHCRGDDGDSVASDPRLPDIFPARKHFHRRIDTDNTAIDIVIDNCPSGTFQPNC